MSHLAKSAVPALRLPAPDLFQSRADRFIAVVKAMARATDDAIQKQITPARHADALDAEIEHVRLSAPIEKARGPRARRTLQVEIEALGRFKPLRSDSAERRAEIAAAAARAKAHERTFSIVSRLPVDEWTPAEFVRVLDQIRRQMPRERHDDALGLALGQCLPGSVAKADRFQDGRRLLRLEVRTYGPIGGQSFILWFSTEAGYAARVHLPGMFPASVFAALATSRDRYASLTLELNNRAIATVGRAQARLQELKARAKAAKAAPDGRR